MTNSLSASVSGKPFVNARGLISRMYLPETILGHGSLCEQMRCLSEITVGFSRDGRAGNYGLTAVSYPNHGETYNKNMATGLYLYCVKPAR